MDALSGATGVGVIPVPRLLAEQVICLTRVQNSTIKADGVNGSMTTYLRLLSRWPPA